MIFNWGRATLGTMPFVALGARYGGVEGAMLGAIAGAAAFGLASVAVAYGVTARLANAMKTRVASPDAGARDGQGDTAMNLNDIIQAAQGGQGINNLASQFGLSPEQAQAAIQAMIPAFSTGLQGAAQNPAALGGILSQLASGAHQGSFTDPSQTGAAGGLGGAVLGQIFGSPQIAAQISQHAAQMSGVSPQVIQQMMPVVASMLMGGLAHSMTSQGMGGLLGQLASAATAPGGLASTLNPAPERPRRAAGRSAASSPRCSRFSAPPSSRARRSPPRCRPGSTRSPACSRPASRFPRPTSRASTTS